MAIWPIDANISYFHKPGKDLFNTYLSGVAKRIASALLMIFSPIYIYDILTFRGIDDKLALVYLLLLYVLIFVVKQFTLMIAEDLSQKVGFKGTVKLSLLPFILFFPAMMLAGFNPWLLLVSSVFWGMHAGLYWWGYHGYFVKSAEYDHLGESVGGAGLLETLAIFITPLMGAITIYFAGFTGLFGLAVIFMIFSAVLLGRNHDRKQRRDVTFGQVWKAIGQHKEVSLAYAGDSAQGVVYAVVWPLFLYLFFGQILSLGIIVSVSALIASIFAVFTGKSFDNEQAGRYFRWGGLLVTFSWLVRFLILGLPAFIFADSLWNFGERMVVTPLNALSYKKAFEGRTAKAVLFRETLLSLGAILSFLIIALLVWVDLKLNIALFASFVFSFLPLIVGLRRKVFK